MDVPAGAGGIARWASRVALVGAAALCVHCAAEPAPDPPDLRPLSASEPSRNVVHEHSAPAPADLADPDAHRTRVFATAACDCEVTSVVFEPDGTIWSAGWFRESVQFGDFALHSRGEADVYLAKTDAQGSVLWAVAAGSPENERNARVSLQDDGSGNVTLTGLTAGRIDCGAGALQQWSEQTYFFCRFRQSDGSLVDGASFPGP